MKKGRAKSLVMQRQYRSQVVRDKTKYRRKTKHKKAPVTGGFFVLGTICWLLLLGALFGFVQFGFHYSHKRTIRLGSHQFASPDFFP